MKTLLKLVVVVAIVNGAYHMGIPEYKAYQLQSATHSMLALGTKTPIEEIKDQILVKARDLGLEVPADNVTLDRVQIRTNVRVSYKQDIEPFPGYKYSKDYSFTDEIAALR